MIEPCELNVVAGEIRIVLKDHLDRISGFQHLRDVSDGEPAAAEQAFTAGGVLADLRPLQPFVIEVCARLDELARALDVQREVVD